MRKYQDSDYAVNKYSPHIVYRFADGVVEVTLQDYLRDNPDKTEQDFAELKALSDEIYYIQDRDDTRYGKRKNTLGCIEESERFATGSPDMELIENNDEQNAIAAAMRLLDSGDLTEVQRKRFILHFFQGLSYRQIADQENVHFTSVRESIEAANTKLKKYFEKI